MVLVHSQQYLGMVQWHRPRTAPHRQSLPRGRRKLWWAMQAVLRLSLRSRETSLCCTAKNSTVSLLGAGSVRLGGCCPTPGKAGKESCLGEGAGQVRKLKSLHTLPRVHPRASLSAEKRDLEHKFQVLKVSKMPVQAQFFLLCMLIAYRH